MKKVLIFLLLAGFSFSFSQKKDNREWYDYPFDESYSPLTINVNAIQLTRADGSGGFNLKNTEERQLMMEYLEKVNQVFSNFQRPKDLAGCYDGTDFIKDSRLRFKYNVMEVPNAYYWDYHNSGANPEQKKYGGLSPSEKWYIAPLDDSISALPIPKAINLYMTENASRFDALVKSKGKGYDVAGNMAGQMPSDRNLKRSSQIHLPNLYLRYIFQRYQAPIEHNRTWEVTKGWWISPGLAHEFGHDLGLSHGNEYYGANKCKYSLMSQKGTDPRNWLPPTEIKKMHWNLSRTNLMQFVTPESAYNALWKLNEDTTWDKPRRFYHNFEVGKGVTLTISDKVILPPQSTVRLNKDSKIIFTGKGQLVDAYGNEYKNFHLHKSAKILKQ